jgi:hypothetical protein
MSYVPRCLRCGQVIGVYEPAVVVNERVAQRTSQAAHQLLGRVEGDRYHLACYELALRRVDEPPGDPSV